MLAMPRVGQPRPGHGATTPTTFDSTRAAPASTSPSAAGIHHCLGAALARLEGQEAIGTLVPRYPALSLAGAPVHNGRIVLRGLDALPLRA